jgi:hypothetical protein
VPGRPLSSSVTWTMTGLGDADPRACCWVDARAV